MRVAVTVGADRFERTARVFFEAGLTPVSLPCVRIEPALPEAVVAARSAASGADLIALSSVRSLEILWPDGAAPPRPVAAVGGVTAHAVRERGGTVAWEGSGGAAAMAESAPLDDRAVVFPHAAGTNPAALRVMKRRSGSLIAPVVYETIPQSPNDDPVDAVVFGSPSAVRGWLRTRSLDRLPVGVIGATTAAAVRATGRGPDVIAAVPDFGVLATAVAAQLEVAR